MKRILWTGMPRQFQWQHALLAAGTLGLCLGVWISTVMAGSFYKYVNDEGAVVVTDSLQHVPPQYRDRVEVREFQDRPDRVSVPVSTPVHEPTPAPTTHMRESSVERGETGTFIDFLQDFSFIDFLPDFSISGLTKYQSVVLIGGFVGACVAFATMAFARNPAVSFAMKWVLTFVVMGTIYALYFSELKTYGPPGRNGASGGPATPRTAVERVKVKAAEIEEIQRQRLGEMDKLIGP